MNSQTKELTSFSRLVAERIRYFSGKGKYKTAANYRCALKHFVAFAQGQELLVEELNVSLMIDFQDYLIRKGLKMNTVSLYMRMLRAAYNYALDEELIAVDRRPFRKVFTGQEKTRKRALPQRTVRCLVENPFRQSGVTVCPRPFPFQHLHAGNAFCRYGAFAEIANQAGICFVSPE